MTLAIVLQEDGYPVWIDREDLTGNTTDAMAQGIDDAAVVIVCMSQKYSESVNCKKGE